MLDRAATGSAAFVVDARQSISAWNAAMADATGIPARSAIGRPCHEVMAEMSGGAAAHCRRSCPLMRAASAGWTSPPSRLTVRRGSDVRSAALHTVTLPRAPGSILHLLHVGERIDAPAAHAAEAPARVITPRQHEVLVLLSEGVAVRGIGERLVLSESTVRNHVRAILRAFGVHSMLQAVSEARRRGLI